MIIRKLDFYTDGAFSSRSEMGGWAAICVEDNNIIETKTGYEPYTTGNRMELMAFLAALESINTIASSKVEVTIYTDSAYTSNIFLQGWYKTWLNNNWKTSDKQDVKNQDILAPMISLYIKLNNKLKLNIVKIKGHAGNKYNEHVDNLARQQRLLLEEE